MPTSKYNYRELPDGDWIRLVTILPEHRRGDGEIEISLSVHALSSSQPYEMLSYVWGGRFRSQTIKCEGGTLEITDNLYLCLLEIREEESRRFLWIDQVCINQQDMMERSRTIPLMPFICENAACTICWIAAPLQPSVSRLVDHLQSRWAQLPQQGSIITDPDPYHADIKITAMNLDLFQADPLLQDKQAWQDLEDLVSLQYFRRHVPPNFPISMYIISVRQFSDICTSIIEFGYH
jgi:hypothetical protein